MSDINVRFGTALQSRLDKADITDLSDGTVTRNDALQENVALAYSAHDAAFAYNLVRYNNVPSMIEHRELPWLAIFSDTNSILPATRQTKQSATRNDPTMFSI